MKKLLLLMCMAWMISCCGSKRNNPPPSESSMERLTAKVGIYLNQLNSVQDSNGFVETKACDALLFTALIASTGAGNIDLEAAKQDDGRWFRRPSKDCYATGASKSTISRDMLLGVYWYIWSHKRLDLAQELWQYGSSRSWIMGDGLRNRVTLTPIMVSTLAFLIDRLGGERHSGWMSIPVYWNTAGSGFEWHLKVLHMMLRERLGADDFNVEDTYAEIAAEQPNNPLFRLANKETNKAVELLLNDKWWPNDRLPTNLDRCSAWITERDYGPSWIGCAEPHKHSGGDLLFVAWLIGVEDDRFRPAS